MINRGVEIAGFLAQHKWDDAQQVAFEADFSPRRYARLIKPDGRHALLMDADPDQKTPHFVRIDKVLRQLDISAPEILAADPRAGLVLLEDFGDRNIGKMLDEGQDPVTFFHRAVNVLAHIHRNFKTDMIQDMDLPSFDASRFSDQASLYLEAYFPLQAERPATADERQTFLEAWNKALSILADLPMSLLLRDYMPDNLMDLPEREGIKNLGVLDFQDAGVGTIAYDLASLTEVVRREGREEMLEDVIDFYCQQMNPACGRDMLLTAATALSAQRHTRILGIVVRLAQKGRSDKLAYLPRIRHHLISRLHHPVLQPVSDWFKRYSPLDV